MRLVTVRPILALIIGGIGIAVIAIPLDASNARLSLATPAVLLVVPVIVTALVGGRIPAVLMAVVAAIVLSYAFIPPVHTLRIKRDVDVVAFAVFVVVAMVVGSLAADLSRRRQLAERQVEEIRAVNEELVRVGAEREALREQASKAAVLEQVDAQRAALLRSVSHDLRTPLVTIHAVATDLLTDDVYDSDVRTELLGLVVAESDRLDRLVANLLDLSRVEAGALRLDLDDHDLAGLVAQALGRVERLFAGARPVVDIGDDLPPVRVDPTLIGQVLTNLLENAARHAGPTAAVVVAADVDNGMAVVHVIDDGPGIDPVLGESAFEPWVTGKVGPGVESSGIGLAICRAIVEAHGGTIRLRDAGHGTHVVFTLPLSPAADDRGGRG